MNGLTMYPSKLAHRWSVWICGAAFVASTLSGCVESDYDISQQTTPVLPLQSGVYMSTENSSLKLYIIQWDTGYKILGEKPGYLRFFGGARDQRYMITQLYPWSPGAMYGYMYAKISAEEFELLGITYDSIPAELKNIVTQDGASIKIIDGPRDTLYFLREMSLQPNTLISGGTYKLM